MKRIMVAALFAVVLVSILLLAMPMTGSAADDPSFTVYPPNSQPFGLTYAQWAVKWWQWELAVPVKPNPNLDLTGQFCAVGQDGPVWFLAGTFSQTANRTCKVPAGKAIFFPVANWAYIGFPWDPNDTPQAARLSCKTGMGGLVNYGAEVDGVPLTNLAAYRLYQGDDNNLPIFDVTVSHNNILGLKYAGALGPSSTDGYYVMLAPLTPGKHYIHFYGTEFGVDVTYDLTVAP